MSSQRQDEKFGAHFLDDIVIWVAENFDVDEVFETDKLKEWAKENGFVEEKELEDAQKKVSDLEDEVYDLKQQLKE